MVLVPPILFHTKSCHLGVSPHQHNLPSPDPVLYSASTQRILASAHTAVPATPLCCAVRTSKLNKILPLCVPADFVDRKRTIRSISILYGAATLVDTTTTYTAPGPITHSSACWTLRQSAVCTKTHFIVWCVGTKHANILISIPTFLPTLPLPNTENRNSKTRVVPLQDRIRPKWYTGN
jgi:hypothetical protein